jgi:tRNA nucleotidyltransferase (CCA-adding enzyme)
VSKHAVSAESLRRSIIDGLPHAARDVVERIVSARPDLTHVYAVGGVVRDAVLGRPLVDVDLVTDGDAVSLVRKALPDARVRTHERFRTATVTADGARVDVATARRETYARPGALPRVESAPLEEDLRRRDFSVNAIAVRLESEAEIVDPTGGLDDIADGIIRVLHDRSFVDDPTRIFRALRYAARLSFNLEPHSRVLLAEALAHVSAVSGDRLRREIELILREEHGGAVLEACQKTGALQAIHPALHWGPAKSRALRSDASRHAPLLAYGFALLAAGAGEEGALAISSRLRLRREQHDAVTGIAGLPRVGEMLRRPTVKPSGVAIVLDRVPPAAIAAYAVTTGNEIARQVCLRYLEEWRHVQPLLRGGDLRDLGVPEGPEVSRALKLIRAARLDGWAGDRDEERALAARYAKSLRDSGQMASPLELQDGNGEGA